MKINIITSVNNDNIIGYEDKLLISSKDDMKYFKHITTKSNNDKRNVCLMGWNTWQSIPNKPLINAPKVIDIDNTLNTKLVRRNRFLEASNCISIKVAVLFISPVDIDRDIV